MARKNFTYQSPDFIPGVNWPIFRKGGTGNPSKGAPKHTVSHWGPKDCSGTRPEILSPRSPLAQEVLHTNLLFTEGLDLWGIETLSDATYAEEYEFDCEPAVPTAFDWYFER